MEIAQTARKTVTVDLTATDAAGVPTAITAVFFGACTHGGPDASTIWQNGNYNAGGPSGTFVACGPLATNVTGACLFSGAMRELWAYGTGPNGDTDPEFIDVVEVR